MMLFKSQLKYFPGCGKTFSFYHSFFLTKGLEKGMYIQVNQLSKKIKGVSILNNVSFNVEKGTVTILKGPNGSGKTMILRTICGLVKPDQGSIMVAQKEIHFGKQLPVSMGIIIETPEFINSYTGFQNLKFLGSIQSSLKQDQIQTYMTKMGMDTYQHQKVAKYSLGMRQRLAIVQAFMEDQEVVLLDEPTNALDADGLLLLNSLIEEQRKKGVTILIATHSHQEIYVDCQHVLHIENGSVKGEQQDA
ncbi:ATP-binding cassette domain-containing protein [Lacticaseibacillus paracasei]|uniref:ATP-binding cassette domain-containing protein n=1 Tax=Lacticaseibacillus paracasei TaxID=1597 RepID=UPI0021CF5E2F|nr:ABC transporter ATP-binding protein [Lacticaseibacillus paracasei]MCU6430813.1 ABC transporter ATP-binding protein [Lacticaseibacillus paracasei]